MVGKIHKRGSTQMLLRVASGNVKICYKKIGIDDEDNEAFRCIEVTQELYKKGVTCMPDERSSVDENGMVEPMLLGVGDFVLVKKNGLYRMTCEEMKAEYAF